jgi:hypothetical protein
MKDLKQLIRESINEYIRGIDEAGENAALEAKMKATTEAIELREKKMKMEGLDEAYHDMLDKGKMKELSSEIKALKKSLAKYEKTLAKLKSKGEKAEETPEEIIDEISLGNDNEDERYDEEGNVDPNGMYDAGANYIGDEGKSMDKAQYDLDPMNENKEEKEFTIKYYPSTQREADDLEKVEIKAKSYEEAKKIFQKKNPRANIINESLNESFLYMQKLAGIITEGQYQAKKKVLNEGEYSDWWAKADDELGLDFGDDIYSYVDSYDEPWQGKFADEVVNIDADSYEDFKNQVKQLYDEINPF